MPTSDTENGVHCIYCGEPMQATASECPACGEAQDIDNGSTDLEEDQPVSHLTQKAKSEMGDAITELENSDIQTDIQISSWVIGLKPGHTLRNVVVGLFYLIFWPIGIIVLLISYLNRGE